MKNFREIFLCSIAVFLFASTSSAYAEIAQKDFQTIMRAIGFLQQKPEAPAIFAIIYDPAASESVRNARQMEEFIQKYGNNTLSARLVSVSSTSQLKEAKFAFITQDLGQYYTQLRPVLLNYKILSFTQDRSCIEEGCCAVFVNSGTRVEIVVNKSVLDIAQLQFKPAFLMMVTLI